MDFTDFETPSLPPLRFRSAISTPLLLPPSKPHYSRYCPPIRLVWIDVHPLLLSLAPQRPPPARDLLNHLPLPLPCVQPLRVFQYRSLFCDSIQGHIEATLLQPCPLAHKAVQHPSTLPPACSRRPTTRRRLVPSQARRCLPSSAATPMDAPHASRAHSRQSINRMAPRTSRCSPH